MSSHYDDDIDDIMASIMQGQPAPNIRNGSIEPFGHKKAGLTKQARTKASPKGDLLDLRNTKSVDPSTGSIKPKKLTKPARIAQETAVNFVPTYYAPAATHQDDVGNTRSYTGLKVATVSLVALVITLVGGAFLWKGPISNALKPKSPFNEELSRQLEIPLYYPTKLPGTYKIELGSITQPESSVVLYAASNNEGKKFNISLQKQLASMDLDTIYSTLSGVREIDTKYGKVKTGVSEDGMQITNVLTGQTWVIITSYKDAMSDSDLRMVIDSLEF